MQLSSEWRWDAKHWGTCLALWTDPEGDSCFSIYQIRWIKIKKELFVNKTRHSFRVCLRFNWQCFRDHLLWVCCKFSERIFFYQTLTPNKPNFVFFLVFVSTAASFTAKISSFETVANEKPFWIPYQTSEYPRIFGVTGANQNVQKLLSTDLVNTNMGYFFYWRHY